VLPFPGPAFIAAVAYVDPGNFATNMAGGSRSGCRRLVVAAASVVTALIIGLNVYLLVSA
jgi:manganese transport protein